MADTRGYCWHCAAPLAAADFTREGRCPRCERQTHVCRNCRFYRPGRHNDCQEPVADAVTDKTRANFCDYFSPNPGAPQVTDQASSPDALRAAAEALFGGDRE
jgi:hypothetical protein